MIFPWYPHDIPMISPWYPHDIPSEYGYTVVSKLFWGQTDLQTYLLTHSLTHIHERFVEGPSTLKSLGPNSTRSQFTLQYSYITIKISKSKSQYPLRQHSCLTLVAKTAE
jgi:hypothetical protein